MSKRIPADPDRCQAMQKSGSFMTLGPREWIRCSNPPTVITSELRVDPEDGETGSMSLCDGCLVVFKERFPEWRAHYRVVNIATGIEESKI